MLHFVHSEIFAFQFNFIIQNSMIDQTLKVKLNQFILAYERQSAELEFQRQNIKQNVMLSIIESKNAKKNPPLISNSQLQKSIVKQKSPRNLASSKQTKISEQRQIDSKKHDSGQNQNDDLLIQKSKVLLTNSKILQKSNVINNRSNKFTNNFVNLAAGQNQSEFQENVQKPRKSGMLNNPYLNTKDKNFQITENNNQEQRDDKLITFNQRRSPLNKSPRNLDNQSGLLKNANRRNVQQQQMIQKNLEQSSISRRSMRPNQSAIQKQLEQNYSQVSQPNAFQRNSRLHPNSQKAVKLNPSFREPQQNEGGQTQYPTFKRLSFQFITNMQDLRQINPNQDESDQIRDEQNEQYEIKDNEQQPCGKWNSIRNKNYEQRQEQRQPENQEQNNLNNYEEQERQVGEPKNFSNIHEDKSMMMASQLKQQKYSHNHQPRKSYLAFQINMQKSNLPSNEQIQQLKKKKIIQLERKRHERMENHSRRKQNSSQISSSSKHQKKQQSNHFFGKKNQSKRQNDNRDSLNKSINEKKNEKFKNLKTNNIKQNQTGKNSALQDNKTIMTKYGDQSRYNQRSTSPINTPLNTIKTTQTDKRPPLNKNRKEENIFAGQLTLQRQRSSQKITVDPKIVPIERKNSFQKKSNLKIMANAITYTCLPGQLNRRQRQKLIDVLEDYENEFFIFLFKQYSRKVIKGIYILEANHEKMSRIYGEKAPLEIFPQQVHEFYRFDSGSRQFKKIDGCKSFSFSIHAIDLK